MASRGKKKFRRILKMVIILAVLTPIAHEILSLAFNRQMIAGVEKGSFISWFLPWEVMTFPVYDADGPVILSAETLIESIGGGSRGVRFETHLSGEEIIGYYSKIHQFKECSESNYAPREGMEKHAFCSFDADFAGEYGYMIGFEKAKDGKNRVTIYWEEYM